ncbi:HK97 family phage prohead protease [Clostridium estertheticum]|uniref:HK97 family phage prohead protease n=1 Tax=Clostridium estertheticum TaxID=238834 RepID=UPI00124DD403|nr:HK97 family phage prohead protease [Clostridium estertheticum]MBZ9615304.1 HK97 family phage prohead protease [Clostridium estertheticum subsp. laramiense]WAG75193.1 HK97 family phage prohead protease [Clostridium estertheticum]
MKTKVLQMNWQVKVLDEANRIIEMIGSDESFDRVGDKMYMAGADLTNYLNNPVIIANHNYGYTEKPSVIGRALDVKIVGSKMIFKIQFAETENGKEWFYLYSNKYMNASSIGFIPKEYKPNDQGGYDFTKWELLELSMVAVPCNPNAVQRAYEDKKISKALFDLIQINESEVENMTSKEVEDLISKAVDDKVKTLETKHTDELALKVKEIEGLNTQIKELKDSVEVKAGTKHSKSTVDAVTKACDGISEHVKALKALVDTPNNQETDGDDDEGDTAKDYTAEQINKMVAESVEKAIKGEK